MARLIKTQAVVYDKNFEDSVRFYSNKHTVVFLEVEDISNVFVEEQLPSCGKKKNLCMNNLMQIALLCFIK